MKENVEYVLAQLSNSRTPESQLKSLYSKLNSNTLSNVQRVRILKVIVSHISKEGYSSDLRIEALSAGLSLVKTDSSSSNNPASGATFLLLEACCAIVKEYSECSTRPHVDVVAKALEILATINPASASKLFSDQGCTAFVKILKSCLRVQGLQLHALGLLNVGFEVPASDNVAKSIMDERAELILLIYPMIFDLDDISLRAAGLQAIKKLKVTCKPQSLWNQLKEDTQKIYCQRMIQMVANKQNWPEIWQFAVKMFGEELHSGGQLINQMLEVLEKAFKHSDFEWTRVQAFLCWKTLIDNFKSGLRNKKRIDLIMIPLKANNHRIESLAKAKLETYDHLLRTLGKDLVLFPDILVHFFSFCFGSEKISCRPVKSYPALHDLCAKSINNILANDYIEEIFVKVYKEVFKVMEDCFVMKETSHEVLSQLWDRLLQLVQKVEVQDAVKMLFMMQNKLVSTAKETSNVSTVSPSPPDGSELLNGTLEKRLVSIAISRMIMGKYALQSSIFKSRSLYVGSCDLLNGTPALLVIEWLLTPSLMLSADDPDECLRMIAQMISICREEHTDFMGFSSLVLKKLLLSDESLCLSKKTLLYKQASSVWCTLAKEIVKYLTNQGSINQGNAAGHDFGALYSVLMFPVQNLFVNLDLVEECSKEWNNLFYEACQQAELIPTASFQHLCEQVCLRLVASPGRNPKQLASIFTFLRCILQVASERLQSVKRLKWLRQHVSGILSNLDILAVDQDFVFIRAASCIHHCLNSSTTSLEVLSNVSATVCSLLRAKLDSSSGLVETLCSLLSAVKEASVALHQRGSSKDAINTSLQGVIQTGKNHVSPKVREIVKELCDTPAQKVTPEKGKPFILISSAALSPSNKSPRSLLKISPQSTSKKFLTVQMSPSNLSPSNAKRKLQAASHASEGKFVHIETPPRKIFLTEHQKEVRRERRQDIPALYQDLSQDTQSMSQDVSQDVVQLPLTAKAEPRTPVDNEDAVMDAADIDSSVQPLSMNLGSPRSNTKERSQVESKRGIGTGSFTPPAGFVLSKVAESKPVHTEEAVELCDDARPGKENKDAPSPSSADLSTKLLRRGAITRSSSSTNLKTRSGKVLKRVSLSEEPHLVQKRKSARKSLPVNSLDDSSKKTVMEPIVIDSDTTDTESVSSVASDISAVHCFPLPPNPQRWKSFKTKDGGPASSESLAEKDPKSPAKDLTVHLNVPLNNELSEKEAISISNELTPTKRTQSLSSGCVQSSNVSPTQNTGIKMSCSGGVRKSLPKLVHQETLSPKCQDSSSQSDPKISKMDQFGVSPPNSSQKPNSLDLKSSELSPNSKVVDVRGTEESQEIIESSQECLINLVKPCLVSLEQFRCSDSNLKTVIEDVIVERGPDATSPFKVHSNATHLSLTAPSVVRRSLKLESEKEMDSVTNTLALDSTLGQATSTNKISPPSKKNKGLLKCGDVSKKHVVSSESNDREILRSDQNAMTEKEQNSTASIEHKARIDAQPDWMHEKKGSPAAKAVRTIRGASARSQAFMKSLADVEFSSSSPPKGSDDLSITSPVPTKKTPKAADAGNSTPTITRSSRAAQLLGLGQAAAARGGDTVVSNTIKPARADKGSELPVENELVISSSSSSLPVMTAPPNNTVNTNSSALNSCTISANTVASPSVRRQTRAVDSSTLKCTPQKSLEDGGLQEDWVPKTPCTTATPDSSILKRKRDVDSDAPSPNVKRKRVSFRDPPLSSMLKWFGESENTTGTLFSSDCSSGPDRAPINLNSEVEDCHDMSAPQQEKETEGKNVLCGGKSPISTVDNLQGSQETNVAPGSPQKGKRRSSSSQIGDISFVNNSTGVQVALTKRSNSKLKDNEEAEPPKTTCSSAVGNNGDMNALNGHDESDEDKDTQGMLDNVFRVPSSSSPVFPKLVNCTHPIKSIAPKLTSNVWINALLREFEQKEIRSVGDLAKLPEDLIDRLSVKQPKRTNVFVVLEEFEKSHDSLKDNICELNQPNSENDTFVGKVTSKLMDVFSSTTDKAVVQTLARSGFIQRVINLMEPEDVVEAVCSNQKILQSLPLGAVIDAKESQDVAAVVGSNRNILQSLPLDLVHTSQKPHDVATAVCSNPEVVKCLPVDFIINAKEPQDVAAVISTNQNVLNCLPVQSVLNSKEPKDVATAICSHDEILKCLSIDSAINAMPCQDVATAVCSNQNIVKSLPVDFIINAKEPQDVAAVIASNHQIMKCLPLESLINSRQPQEIQAAIVALLSKLIPQERLVFLLDYLKQKVLECVKED